jgi:flagellar motor switch protein FliM
MNKIMTPEEIAENGKGVIDEIIRMSDFNFDRLPMLDIIGERLADSLTAVIPELTGVICEASLTNQDYLPMAQAMDGLAVPSFLGVVEANHLNGEILMALDSTFALTAMELMLGGAPKGELKRQSEEFTMIERGFARRIGDVLTLELRRCLAMVADVDMELDRVETDPDAAMVTQPTSLVCRMRFAAALAGRTGAIEVIIPYDALEPIRPKLGKIHFGEPNEDGSPWKDKLTEQIERSVVELEAVLTEIELPIQTLLNWKPGETVNLWIEEDHEARVICAETDMFKALMGKRNNGNTAIRITERIEAEEETEHGRDID